MLLGRPVSINYIADELGFRATGSAIPTSPPSKYLILFVSKSSLINPFPFFTIYINSLVPEAIAKSLQLIARTQPAPASHNFNAGSQQQFSHNHHNQHKYGK